MAGTARIEVAVPDAAAMSAYLRDIEAGVVSLRTKDNPSVGEPVEVALVLPGGAPLLVTGRVERIDADGFGLALDPLSDAVRAALVTARLSAPPPDLRSAQAVIDRLNAELHEARERVGQLQREAETNRAFYARALAQAHGPQKSKGPRWDHFLSLAVGVGCGVVLTLGLIVARAPANAPARPSDPAPRAATRTATVAPAPTAPTAVRDGGVLDAGRPAAPRAGPVVADDSGSLNLLSTGDADVFVDGRHVGRSPARGITVRPGEHAVRFACVKDASRSAEQKVNVPAFADVDVEHACE